MQEARVELYRALIAAHEHSNLAAAAHSLRISQPTLSRQLQELEDDIGVTLFHDSGRRKLLTLQAQELCAKIRERLNDLDQDVAAWRSRSVCFEDQELRIGGRIALISRLQRQLPARPCLVARDMSSGEVVPALLRQEIEIGIVSQLPPRSEMIARKFFTEEWGIVASRGLLRATRVDDIRRLMISQPSLAYSTHLPELESLLSHYKVPMKSLRYSRILPDWNSLIACANEGLGWVVAPLGFCENAPKSLRIIRIPASVVAPSNFHVVARRELLKRAGFREWFARHV